MKVTAICEVTEVAMAVAERCSDNDIFIFQINLRDLFQLNLTVLT